MISKSKQNAEDITPEILKELESLGENHDNQSAYLMARTSSLDEKTRDAVIRQVKATLNNSQN